MIKKIVVLFFVLFIYGNISAQDLYKADPRLKECLSDDFITQLENSKSELLLYYNYFLENSYYAVNLKSVDKPVTGADIHNVKIKSDISGEVKKFSEKNYQKEKFNPLKYDFSLSMNSFTTYLWKDAGIAIVFYPLSHISADFKSYIKTK